MEITLVTLHDNAIKSYAELTFRGKQEYCQKWGYHFLGFTSKIDMGAPASWSKIPAILSAMDQFPNSKYIFWTDADALIVDHETQLEQFMDRRYQLLVSSDIGGLNLGNFFIRNSEWGRNLLNAVGPFQRDFDLYWEQCAMRRYFNVNVHEQAHVKHMGDAFNNYPMQPRGFMLHCAGMNTEDRYRIIAGQCGLL